jgi:hypothetical protein
MKTIDILFKVLFGSLTILSFVGIFLSETASQYSCSIYMTILYGLGFYALIKIGSYGKL